MSNVTVDKIKLELSIEDAITIGCATARSLPPKDTTQGNSKYYSSLRQLVVQMLSVAYGYDATELVDTYAKEATQ